MRIVTNSDSNEFDPTSSDVSTESSDFEFFSKKDIKDSGNQISEQWEAIERTLYQEPGQQVTDPELLKECKLWRDAFPHFRVKGTKINVLKTDDEKKDEEKEEENIDSEKSIQTLSSHFSLMKINEKRESVKKKIVGKLVEKLIAKFNKEGCDINSYQTKESCGDGLKLSEISDSSPRSLSGGKLSTSKKNIGKVPDFLNKTEKHNDVKEELFNDKAESYFERGKLLRNLEYMRQADSDSVVTREQMEQGFYEVFDDWEKEIDEELDTRKPQKKNSPGTQGILKENFPKSELPKPNLDRSKSNSRRLKPNKLAPPTDSLSRLVKPFEIEKIKKIDKKYEGLLEKILERNQNNLIRSHRINDLKKEVKTYNETLENLKLDSIFDESRKSFPKINKFNNHWLERGEINSHICDNDFSQRSLKTAKTHSNNKSRIDSNANLEKLTHFGLDDKLLEELQTEMLMKVKRPPQRSGLVDKISFRRPKPYFNQPEQTGKNQKSSSCGDLPRKTKKVKQTNPVLESMKTTKSTNFTNNKVKQNYNLQKKQPNHNRNGLLPPIDNGIICTELAIRPKIGIRKPPKR